MSGTLPSAKPADVGLSAARLARMSDILKREIDGRHVPGTVVLIARRGKVAHVEALGARGPDGGAMTPDTVFRIYSMTKPIVSVAAMMLLEQGRFALNEPVAKYLPEFGDTKVAVEGSSRLELVPAQSPITIQDLMRHTSGLTYEFFGAGPVQRAYQEAKIARRDQTNADQAAMLGKLPLLYQPGTRWNYGRSTASSRSGSSVRCT